ncbi:MAG: hypothetical protein ACKV22_12690, partial [Bryobacteraceae bacterium]
DDPPDFAGPALKIQASVPPRTTAAAVAAANHFRNVFGWGGASFAARLPVVVRIQAGFRTPVVSPAPPLGAVFPATPPIPW